MRSDQFYHSEIFRLKLLFKFTSRKKRRGHHLIFGLLPSNKRTRSSFLNCTDASFLKIFQIYPIVKAKTKGHEIMADRGSWRNWKEGSNGGGGGVGGVGGGVGGKKEDGKDEGQMGGFKPKQNSSDLINPTASSHLPITKQSNQFATRRNKVEEFGPAAPLQPLHISAGKSLPHPSSYSGTDNWAFTPSDTLPSLPATPSRAMHAMGWNRTSTPANGNEIGNSVGTSGGQGFGPSTEMNNRYPQSTPSREKGASLGARAVLNKRMDEQRNYSPSPNRNQRPSPRVGMSSLGSPSHDAPRPGMFGSPISSADAASTNITSSGQRQSIASVLNQATSTTNETGSPAMMPALHHRDSVQSIASSTNQSLGQHLLSHSRRPSQVFTASPAMSNATGSSIFRQGAPYRVYRPPHLRTESYFSLQPKVAHYDRVSAPMLRGQSRSPSVSRSRSDSVVISRTPSESNFANTSPRIGQRRPSNLSNQESSPQSNQNQALSGYGTGLDSNSLIAKLANAKLDLKGRTAGNSPLSIDEHNRERNDDVDLSVEDMMMSGTLTDQYYRSRTASISSTQGALVDIFEIGDRLGPKMMHDGHEITIAQTSDGFHDQSADWTGTQLEIVSKLGEGSYAVVYLVKEVPRMEGFHQISVTPVISSSGERLQDVFQDDIDQTSADETVLQNGDMYGTTIKASASGKLAEKDDDGHDAKLSKTCEDRLFALKCLCKRDLSEEMLEVQRLESTIHQSIPHHPNIVTLYRTYETPEWLFLVLEYCPGQDLFYWLEQAHDTENLGAATPGGNSDEADADLTAMDATPPSPSLLASTNSKFLLSRRRLKLIGRMFQQICEAVGFCHDRGISHRDIKPENFIVEDTRGSNFASDPERKDDDVDVNRIKVKLTDFGLAVAQTKCIDFDCGSKPYMSYECRNNTLRWYNPIESDIWSLGIVLLNLIFHRNPFTEPNVERCASFASYVQDPVRFLTTAFRGLKHEAAQFLAEQVFCDVTEGEEENERRHRISAREFGDWASNLADHLESQENRQNMKIDHSTTNFLSPNMDTISAGADLGITSPLWHSRSPTSSLVNSLMASPASNPKSVNIYQELANMGISEEEIDSFTPLFTDSITTSETRQRESSTMTETSLEPIAETMGSAPSSSEHRSSDNEDRNVNGLSVESPTSTEVKDFEENDHSTVETSVENENGIKAKEEVEATDEVSERDDRSVFPPPSVTSTSANPKRRKRGARKGRTLAKQQLKRSQSAENLHTEENSSLRPTESARDQIIRELAEASQSLAREMSKAIHNRDEAAASIEPTAFSATDLSSRGIPITAPKHTISSQTAMELKELQNRLAVPEIDAATTTVSSLNSVSRGSTTSRASSHFTNFGWSDSRRIGSNATSDNNTNRQEDSLYPSMNQSNVSLMMKNRLQGSQSGGFPRHILQDSGRARIVHPSSTAADWRERNTSNASLASISSINTLNSYSSDIGSIHSTASAPPAMVTQHHRRGGSGLSSLHNVQQTTSSASSARSMGLSGIRTGTSGSNASIASRNMALPGSRNLGTINEKSNATSAQGNLDASYLAGIFGGKGSSQSNSKNQKGEVRASMHGGKGVVEGMMDSASARGSFTSQRSLNDDPSSLPGMRGGRSNDSNISLDQSSISHQSHSSEAVSNPDSIYSAPRKKMLGKFLQGVKNYNKGVKAAPAMPPSDDQESSDTGIGTGTEVGASSATPGKSTPTSSASSDKPGRLTGSGMHIQMQ